MSIFDPHECEHEGCTAAATHISGESPAFGPGWEIIDQGQGRQLLCPDHTNERVGDCSDRWWFRGLTELAPK